MDQIKIKANNIAVDSGTIFLADLDFYNKWKDPFKNWPEENVPIDQLIEIFDVPKGKYKVHWYMPNTWNGEVDDTGELEITSGKLVVSDPCYLVPDDKWGDFLDDTEFFQKGLDGIVVLDQHGGDGCFLVNAILSIKH